MRPALSERPPLNERTLPPQRAWVALALFVLALALWFGYGLGDRALWHPDEGRYAEIPREMVETGDLVTPRLNGVKYFEKPPLFYWLQAGSIKLFGLDEWALRLWPALFGVFGALTVYGAGRALFGRRAGLIAAAVLATSPLYYLMARIITLDIAVSVLLTGALLAFLLGVRAPEGRTRALYLYGFYALCALAVLAKGLIGLVIPAMVIGAWVVLLWDWRLLLSIRLPTGLLLFFAIAAPWHVLVARANPEFADFYFIYNQFERYLTDTPATHGRYQPWWFFFPVLVFGMLPWIALVPQALRASLTEWRQHREELFLLLWAVLVFAFFSASGSKLIPYILPALPPLALLVGRYLDRAWEAPRRPGLRLGFWLLLALAAALAAYAWASLAARPQALAELARFGARGWVLAVLLGACLAALFLLGRARSARAPFAALTLAAAGLVAVFDGGSPALDDKHSIKAHAAKIKKHLKPSDEVATYRAYYQDLPVYLDRRITVVDWKGELEFGAQQEDVSGWMIDQAEFRRRWHGPGTVYLLTDRKNLDDLRALGFDFRVLGENAYTVLLINREAAS